MNDVAATDETPLSPQAGAPATVVACDWQPTGAVDAHGKPYKTCARCGRGPWAFHKLAARVACGRREIVADGGVISALHGPASAPMIILDGCTGCGEKSTAAKQRRPIVVPVDYPGAAED